MGDCSSGNLTRSKNTKQDSQKNNMDNATKELKPTAIGQRSSETSDQTSTKVKGTEKRKAPQPPTQPHKVQENDTNQIEPTPADTLDVGQKDDTMNTDEGQDMNTAQDPSITEDTEQEKPTDALVLGQKDEDGKTDDDNNTAQNPSITEDTKQVEQGKQECDPVSKSADEIKIPPPVAEKPSVKSKSSSPTQGGEHGNGLEKAKPADALDHRQKGEDGKTDDDNNSAQNPSISTEDSITEADNNGRKSLISNGHESEEHQCEAQEEGAKETETQLTQAEGTEEEEGKDKDPEGVRECPDDVTPETPEISPTTPVPSADPIPVRDAEGQASSGDPESDEKQDEDPEGVRECPDDATLETPEIRPTTPVPAADPIPVRTAEGQMSSGDPESDEKQDEDPEGVRECPDATPETPEISHTTPVPAAIPGSKPIYPHMPVMGDKYQIKDGHKTIRFYTHMPPKLKKVCEDLLTTLRAKKLTKNTTKCDVILAFCPAVSRLGTDVEAALRQIPDTKPCILVVMHVTFDPDYVIPDSKRFVKGRNVATVDCLCYEDSLLQCSRNDESLHEIITILQRYEKVKMCSCKWRCW